MLFSLCLHFTISTQGWDFSGNSLLAFKHTVYIDPSSSNCSNDSSCYNGLSQTPCCDINVALAFPFKQFSTKFVLSSKGNHSLKSDLSLTAFEGGYAIAFYGDGNNNTATVVCQQGAGLSFVNSTNIIIQYVSFLSCSSLRNSTSKDFNVSTFTLKTFLVGLYFYNCQNVTLDHMSVLNGTNAVGVVMYSTVGMNYIRYSQFMHNAIADSSQLTGGGGFAVEFPYCKPGDNMCSDDNHQLDNVSHAVYLFDSCEFTGNRGKGHVSNSTSGIFVLPVRKNHLSFGRGGGLSIYFKGTAFNNTVLIRNCQISYNHADWGGGLLVEFDDDAIQNQVNVSESCFYHNHCYYMTKYGVAGGGARIASSVYYQSSQNKSLLRNEVSISHSNFSYNKALSGGGLSLSFHRQDLSYDHQVFRVDVSNSNFSNNSARLGSAVNVEHEHFYTSGKLGSVNFNSSMFCNNSILFNNKHLPYSVGMGAVYVSEIPVTFSGTTTFFQNKATALAIVGTTANFSGGNFSFLKNSGSNGGAIGLHGVATMIISNGTIMLFSDNTAERYGGAIYNEYVGMEDLPSSVKCFIQYVNPFHSPKIWDARFVFNNNKAKKTGNSIFSSTILPCSWQSDTQADLDPVDSIFCWNTSIWIYNNSNCSDEIYSFAKTFSVPETRKEVFPGRSFRLHIKAFDDLHHDITRDVIFTASVNSSTAEVQPQYAYVAGGYVGINGEENQNITLALDTARPRDWHIEVPLLIRKCPPGFMIAGNRNNSSNQTNESTSECVCLGHHSTSYGGNLLCEEKTLKSLIRNGYWIGKVPKICNKTLYMAETTFITNGSGGEEYMPLPRRYNTLELIQCEIVNRKGPLCGECIDNYSTAVNSYSYKCVPCSNIALNVLAYISLTYLPYLVLFLCIVYFDIRVMSGPAVGFILYSQLISAGLFDLSTQSVEYSENVLSNLTKAYRIVYGVLNLDSLSQLIDPFCVNENFTALDVISLDFAIALFPLFLIIIIRLFMRLKSIKCRRRQRGIRNMTSVAATQSVDSNKSLLHPFVAFIYLSYAKFSITSAKLMSTTQLMNQDGVGIYPQVLYYAGQYRFDDLNYIFPYGIMAISVYIFCVTLPPLVLLGPIQLIDWITDKPRFAWLKRHWPTIRIHIFLDAFQGCYKPKRQYFAGIYFLFRLIMFTLYAFTFNSITFLLWQQFFLTIIIVLVAFLQPYKAKILNYVDTLILVNLATINCIEMYLGTVRAGKHHKLPVVMFATAYVLIWLPLICMLVYVMWWSCRKLFGYPPLKRKLSPLLFACCQFAYLSDDSEQRPLLSPIAKTGNIRPEPDSLTDSGMFQRAEHQNRFQPLDNSSHKDIPSTIVSVHGTSGIADVHSTQVSVSSGIVSGGPESLNTGDSQSSKGHRTFSS